MAYKDFIGTASWSRGQKREAEFGDLLKKSYPEARPATLPEQYQSIDWICDKGTIDVKAMKRVATGSPIQSEFIWIEFRNNVGRKGWIYGEQDWLAFEAPDRYIMVKRSDLAALAEKLCNLEDAVESAKDALYKSYTRKNRKDVISMIRFSDLLKIDYSTLMKEL